MPRPNVLLITSDQQHWNTIGAFNPGIQTPNLDRLVAGGTTFTRAYCPNPTCTPTRASIITGRYPSQHGAWALGTKLPEGTHTVGDDFRANGYRSELIGKAHFEHGKLIPEEQSLEAPPKALTNEYLDFWRSFHGPYYGFDHVELHRFHAARAVSQHYAVWLEENGLEDWVEYFTQGKRAGTDPQGESGERRRGLAGRGENGQWAIPEHFHYDAWIAERVDAALKRHQANDESFFLWASFQDPHPPYMVPAPWDTMYDPAEVTLPTIAAGEHDRNPPHFAMTQDSEADFSWYSDEPGAHFAHGMHSHVVEPAQMRKNIAVYYGMISLMDKYIGKILDSLDRHGFADNTIVVFTTDHGHFLGQHGLTAKGPFHYEDMIRVPLVVLWPGRVPAGRTSAALQSLVDLAPTFLTACGIDPPSTMTGINQLDVWTGATERIRDRVFCENRHNPTRIHLKTLVNQRYKITVYYEQTYGELFDLELDPHELRNLWDDPAAKDLKSRMLLEFAWAELGIEPMWMPRVAVA